MQQRSRQHEDAPLIVQPVPLETREVVEEPPGNVENTERVGNRLWFAAGKTSSVKPSCLMRRRRCTSRVFSKLSNSRSQTLSSNTIMS